MTGTSPGKTRLNELAHRYITEGSTPLRQAAAIGIGLFVGCLPLYGLHLPICLGVGAALGLNRLKLYLAANVSNPVLSPFLVLASIQIAGRLQNGTFYPMSLETLSTRSPWEFGWQLLWGSALVGLALGVLGFLVTYGLKLRSTLSPAEEKILERAARPYVPFGIATWWRASARLRRDPFYRAVALGRVVPLDGAVLDVSCGRGVLLSAVRAGREAGKAPLSLLGIERDRRAASIARAALKDATIVEGDPLTVPFPPSRVVFLVDVLETLASEAERVRLLEKAARAIEDGGSILVRERAGNGRRWVHLLQKLGFESGQAAFPSGEEVLRAVKRGSVTRS